MSWVQDFFRSEQIETLPLEVELDARDDGWWVTKIGYRVSDQYYPIEDLVAASTYGFRVYLDDTQYIFSNEGLEILQSVRALNAERKEPGIFITEMRPPILKFLRNKDQVQEAESSKEYEIHDEPILLTARVDFEPGEGCTVETGYAITDDGPMLSEGELPITPDGGYFQLEKAFIPLPRELSEGLQKWLDIGRKKINLSDVPEFFQRDLVLLKSDFQAVLTDRAARIHIIQEPLEPRVSVRNDEPGWLDFKIEYVAGDHVVPADLIRNAKEKYVQPDPYTFLETDSAEARKLEKAFLELNPVITVDGYRLPVERFASLEDFIEKIGGEAELSAEYQAFLENLTGFEADENYRLPEKIEKRLLSQNFHLRPYQRAGVHWLDWLRSNHLHGMLADDMGLGKTLQTIVNIRMAYDASDQTQHSLIICPKSVVHHWGREFSRIAPHLQYYEYLGSSRRRDYLKSSKPIIFISTYSTARNDVEILKTVPFLFIVLDEATRIKNPNAQRTQAIKRLNSAYRITLSGTPVENRPQELWSQFDFLMAGHLGKYGTFERVFANPITRGEQEVSEKLGQRIRPFILRRTKGEVAKDLPEKIDMDEWCELTEEQKSLYGQILDQFAPVLRDDLESGRKVDAFSILPILTKLKQVCDHPAIITGEAEPVRGRSEKFDLAVEKIISINDAGEQVVLFSHFLRMLDLLEIALVQENIQYLRVDGSTPNRHKVIDRFNRNATTAILCSLQAMSHGVNLQTANHVIHVDRWWNPAVEDQATDRVHRIGQEKQVYVYRLIVQGTLEERIDRLQEKKRGMADSIVGAATRGGMSWSRDELLEILKPLGE